jgi:hypothetical protein
VNDGYATGVVIGLVGTLVCVALAYKLVLRKSLIENAGLAAGNGLQNYLENGLHLPSALAIEANTNVRNELVQLLERELP